MTTNYEKIKEANIETMACMLSQLARYVLSLVHKRLYDVENDFSEMDLEITRDFYKWLIQECE